MIPILFIYLLGPSCNQRAAFASGNATNFALPVAPILNGASSVDEDHERSCEVRSHLNHELRNLSSATPAASNLLTENLDADPDEANRTKTVKIHALRTPVALAIACGLLDAEQTRAAAESGKSAFVFDGVGYLHRWSMNHQHEFTPEGQEDLEKWSDMITINVYPDAHDGEALATKANAVLENYKSHNGKVLRTSSVPRTPKQPAEHFIAVVFGRPNFIEVAFARFQLVNGLGCSIVYSHRIYGEKIGDQMSDWLKNNGAEKEKALMEWNDIPSPASLNKASG
jgi:hypothetical protein